MEARIKNLKLLTIYFFFLFFLRCIFASHSFVNELSVFSYVMLPDGFVSTQIAAITCCIWLVKLGVPSVCTSVTEHLLANGTRLRWLGRWEDIKTHSVVCGSSLYLIFLIILKAKNQRIYNIYNILNNAKVSITFTNYEFIAYQKQNIKFFLNI